MENIYPTLLDNWSLVWIMMLSTILAFCYLVFFVIYLPLNNRKKGCHTSETEEEIDRGEWTNIGVSSVAGTRHYQQDRALYTIDKKRGRVIAVLCDGMGGMTNGELASEYCSTTFIKSIQEDDPEWSDIPIYLKCIVRKMDNRVSCFTDENNRKIDTGTTFIACCINQNEMYFVSVGDSRIYVLEDNNIRQITRDQNYSLKLEAMVAAGIITEQQAKEDPSKDALISYIGIGHAELVDVNISPLRLAQGSIILLCSDGITKLLSDAHIKDIILKYSSYPATHIARKLTDEATAMRKNSQDNTTAVIIKINEDIQ